MPQNNLIFHQPAEEKHCKEPGGDTSVTATTMGSGPSTLLVWMMSLSRIGNPELVFVGHLSVQSLSNHIDVNNIKCFSIDFIGVGCRISFVFFVTA